jgi:pentatricopeptide repeat protein
MDHLRVLLVPFHPTNLIMVGIFSVLLTFCLSAGFYGWFAAWFLQVWVLKYCYVLVEHLADGAAEPPVMDTDMLSPFEIRPWVQAALLLGGGWLCHRVDGTAGIVLAIMMLALLPATVAILGFGEAPWKTVNPLTWFQVVRGLGPYYVLLLIALLACAGVFMLLARVNAWALLENAILLWCAVAFFSLVGACLFVRRKQLGFEPSRSPERAASRAETERLKLRARMIDEVFQLVRIGRHVDATAPLAKWLRDSDAENVSKDAYHAAEQALRWETPAALNPIGSTLIRHLMRFGRPDAALSIFELLRSRGPNFTMDSASDLRTMAEYAESVGRDGLAQSMRLETPVYQPHPKA